MEDSTPALPFGRGEGESPARCNGLRAYRLRPGFSLLRLLSERERSKVYLARDTSGALCAVKLKLPHDPAGLAELAGRVKRLQPLSGRTGLLPILSYGVTESGWLWKSFPLADNLPGLPPLGDEAGLQQYTPLTLRAWSTEHGPASAELVGRWGARLADALAVLHAAGLVHRDVKPENILFVSGEPCLGDYGLAGEPGCKPDFHGTEGYRPLEGTSDTGGDLFALGKTLYETWTARDRLEFPSLPRAVLDAPDWNERGSQLNDIILRACHAQPRKRFGSAAELSEALSRVVSGQRPLNRRRWLLAGAGLAVAGVAGIWLPRLLRAPARVVWRRMRQKGFNVESWQGHMGTADWTRGRLYSLAFDSNGLVLESVDMNQFTLEVKVIPGGPKADCQHDPASADAGIVGDRRRTGRGVCAEPGNGEIPPAGRRPGYATALRREDLLESSHPACRGVRRVRSLCGDERAERIRLSRGAMGPDRA